MERTRVRLILYVFVIPTVLIGVIVASVFRRVELDQSVTWKFGNRSLYRRMEALKFVLDQYGLHHDSTFPIILDTETRYVLAAVLKKLSFSDRQLSFPDNFGWLRQAQAQGREDAIKIANEVLLPGQTLYSWQRDKQGTVREYFVISKSIRTGLLMGVSGSPVVLTSKPTLLKEFPSAKPYAHSH